MFFKGYRFRKFEGHLKTNSSKLLLSLVTPSIEVLKDLKKDTATNKKKEAVWAQIVVSFNANPTISARRTIDQLRKAWENICRRTKEEVAKNKQSRRQTGGGPAGPEVSRALVLPELWLTLSTLWTTHSMVTLDIMATTLSNWVLRRQIL
jgi:hypothetical protein